jgi:hypothetical protein
MELIKILNSRRIQQQNEKDFNLMGSTLRLLVFLHWQLCLHFLNDYLEGNIVLWIIDLNVDVRLGMEYGACWI